MPAEGVVLGGPAGRDGEGDGAAIDVGEAAGVGAPDCDAVGDAAGLGALDGVGVGVLLGPGLIDRLVGWAAGGTGAG